MTSRSKTIPLAALCLSASGCDGGLDAPGGLENSCRESVTGQLLNPETAEFFDFSESSASSYLRAHRDWWRKATVVDGWVEPRMRLLAEEMLLKEVRKESERISRDGVSLHSIRVRHENASGQRVTEVVQCSSTQGQCVCRVLD